jgi:hypothetical protein
MISHLLERLLFIGKRIGDKRKLPQRSLADLAKGLMGNETEKK